MNKKRYVTTLLVLSMFTSYTPIKAINPLCIVRNKGTSVFGLTVLAGVTIGCAKVSKNAFCNAITPFEQT